MNEKIRKPTPRSNLPCLRLEGGLFLPDQLEKAALGQRPMLQTEADYGTPKGLKLKDEYSRAFQIACAQWKHFARALERADVDPAQETLRFVHELLRDAFGYTAALLPWHRRGRGRARYPVSLMAGTRAGGGCAAHADALTSRTRALRLRAAAAAGNRPFQLAQELLNASPDHRWAHGLQRPHAAPAARCGHADAPELLEIDLQDLLGGATLRRVRERLAPAARQPRGTGATPRNEIWEKWRDCGAGGRHARARGAARQGVTEALAGVGRRLSPAPGERGAAQRSCTTAS
jgi:hypothetical protein